MVVRLLFMSIGIYRCVLWFTIPDCTIFFAVTKLKIYIISSRAVKQNNGENSSNLHLNRTRLFTCRAADLEIDVRCMKYGTVEKTRYELTSKRQYEHSFIIIRSAHCSRHQYQSDQSV